MDFARDVFHVKKLIYMTYTSFKEHIYSLIHYFTIIKCFHIECRPPPTPKIIQVNVSTRFGYASGI